MTPPRFQSRFRPPARQRGFGYIAALLIVVALGGLSLAVMRINNTQQVTGMMDLQSAHADQAARAGIEWGLYRALVSDTCAAGVIDLTGVAGFRAAVTCERRVFSEGETAAGEPILKNLYRITATACNAATCPGNAAAVATPGYVERKRSAAACAVADPVRSACY
ncbi:MSHA biogenesis protein MshP [Pseudoduganella lutea]|uniref:MSHA biogenesis protein MshP n=1 Tax=Pseudoduganella lutea TaxID=321985 RepID=A0A4P6L4T2_9BURK|nr:MSHA biogenesis protein MshP [Pseudoduganella lutea]QBE66666.1 MSHA biogenesis protein MshP [Pseudoduganella lutea]